MLQGVSVLVAGAGLAGLTAARDLVALGATVTVVDARDRVGGRVFTMRAGFAAGQHGEAGGDMIDASHTAILDLARELGLDAVQILKAGWAIARPDERGVVRVSVPDATTGWLRLVSLLAEPVRQYRAAERRWDSPITHALTRKTVAQWLEDSQADPELRATAAGLRDFFLADPEELSLAALVDLCADESLTVEKTYRIRGGNDQLATALAAPLAERLKLNTELAAISMRGERVRASLRHKRQTQQLTCDYLVCTLPASVLRRIPITPALPAQQHDAIATLSYGRATKSLLQFSSRFWRVPGKPSAFATTLPIGAVWDGNEEQRGKPAILSLAAGGSASDATIELMGRDGTAALGRQLDWLGAQRAQLLTSYHVSWENDPLARGGYAFFDTGFAPDLRRWLARPCGRVVFAGEHTSHQWQGYMNGAVETGRRAAAEVAALHSLIGARRPARRLAGS